MNEINLNDANQVPDESADVNVGPTVPPETEVEGTSLPSQNLKNAVQREMDSRDLLIKNLEEEVSKLQEEVLCLKKSLSTPPPEADSEPLEPINIEDFSEEEIVSKREYFLKTSLKKINEASNLIYAACYTLNHKKGEKETVTSIKQEQLSQANMRLRKVFNMVNACL